MYTLAAASLLIPSLLAGSAWCSPLTAKGKANALATESWTGSNNIYVIDSGDVNGCLDEAMTWTTEDNCGTFWVHSLPQAGYFWLSSKSENDGLTCKSYKPSGVLDCYANANGATSFSSAGKYLSFGHGDTTNFWAKRAPKAGGKPQWVSAYHDNGYDVSINLVWGNPGASSKGN